MNYIISIFIGYIIGSIPTAYILLKITKGVDIRENGSGNVGAMNTLNVSKSKLIGFFVLLVDLLKGLLSVYISILLFNEFIYAGLTMLFSVIGHCFSVWIKLKGGRGLATAAGGSVLISLPVLIIWSLLWIIGFIFRKSIHFGNISATILTGAIVITSSDILMKYSGIIFPELVPASTLEYSLIFGAMFLIIFIKHFDPLKNYIKQQKKKVV